jgi:hypothetical protein
VQWRRSLRWIRSPPGPHGIPLMVHAKAGGDEARAVVDYLEALDAA